MFRQGDEHKGEKWEDDKFYSIMKGEVQVSIAKTEIRFFDDESNDHLKKPLAIVDEEDKPGPSQALAIPEKRLGLKKSSTE